VLILKIIFLKKKTLKKQTYNSLHKRTKNKEMSCQNTQEIAMNCLNQIQNDRMESKVINRSSNHYGVESNQRCSSVTSSFNQALLMVPYTFSPTPYSIQ
jgi:hypothetical protein